MICKYFLPVNGLSFRFVAGFLCLAVALESDEVSLVYFFFCFPCLSRHGIQKDPFKSDLKVCTAYILFQKFYGFRSYFQVSGSF